MLIIKRLNFGERNYNQEIKLCEKLMDSLGIKEKVKMNIYSKFPNKVKGNLIYSEYINLFEKDLKLKDYVKSQEYSLNELIIEFEFILHIYEEEISGYVRINNELLRKNYGDIELDIYPFKDISNFGDLIRKYNLEKIKISIEKIISRDSKELGISIKEAYIAVSIGEPSIDLSKRIWIYYSNPLFLVSDLISFIKNFKELEIDEDFQVPKYLIPEYDMIIHKIKPYNIDFLSREFMSSGKFIEKLELAIEEKQMDIRKGSLILSSNKIENNFLLVRDLSEKMIFPVMKNVTGDKEFREILNKSF